MEYASETAAVEAAKKYQDVELGGNKLYVIKSMIERVMSFGKTPLIIIYLFVCQFYFFSDCRCCLRLRHIECSVASVVSCQY